MSVPPDPARALEAARNNAVQHLSRRLAADYPATYKAIAALAAASADLLDALAAAPPSPPLIEGLARAARRAKSVAAAPDYDEEAIRDALWHVVDLVLAAARGETREDDARLAAMETENARLEAYDDLAREEPSGGR